MTNEKVIILIVVHNPGEKKPRRGEEKIKGREENNYDKVRPHG